MRDSVKGLIDHLLDIRAMNSRHEWDREMGTLLLGLDDYRGLLKELSMSMVSAAGMTENADRYEGVRLMRTPTPGIRYVLAELLRGTETWDERLDPQASIQLFNHALARISDRVGAGAAEIVFLMGPRQLFINRGVLSLSIDYDRPYAYYAKLPVYAVEKEGFWVGKMLPAWEINHHIEHENS